jgi:hypothetical protein
LYDVNLRVGAALNAADIIPRVAYRVSWEVVEEANVRDRISSNFNTSGSKEACHASFVFLPAALNGRAELPVINPQR